MTSGSLPTSPQHIWRIHEYGNPKGRPIVCLHGWLGEGRRWLPLLEGWPEEHRWLLPDIPGHGLEPWGLEVRQKWSFPFLLESLLETLRNDYQLEACDLVGYSMGGRLALYLAHRATDFVRSLFLESCQPGISEEQARQERAALDDERAATLRELGLQRFVGRWYQAPLFASLREDPTRLAQVSAARCQHEEEGVASALASLSPGRQPPLWDSLSSLVLPVALLTGEKDTKYTKIMTKMAGLLPNATLTIAENAGHNVHMESPDAWRHTLGVHLERCPHTHLPTQGKAR